MKLRYHVKYRYNCTRLDGATPVLLGIPAMISTIYGFAFCPFVNDVSLFRSPMILHGCTQRLQEYSGISRLSSSSSSPSANYETKSDRTVCSSVQSNRRQAHCERQKSWIASNSGSRCVPKIWEPSYPIASKIPFAVSVYHFKSLSTVHIGNGTE